MSIPVWVLTEEPDGKAIRCILRLEFKVLHNDRGCMWLVPQKEDDERPGDQAHPV